MSPTLQVVSTSPTSCPNGEVVSGGSCVAQSSTDTFLQIFGAPARLLGMQPDAMGMSTEGPNGYGAIVVGAGIWLVVAMLLFGGRR